MPSFVRAIDDVWLWICIAALVLTGYAVGYLDAAGACAFI